MQSVSQVGEAPPSSQVSPSVKTPLPQAVSVQFESQPSPSIVLSVFALLAGGGVDDVVAAERRRAVGVADGRCRAAVADLTGRAC